MSQTEQFPNEESRSTVIEEVQLLRNDYRARGCTVVHEFGGYIHELYEDGSGCLLIQPLDEQGVCIDDDKPEVLMVDAETLAQARGSQPKIGRLLYVFTYTETDESQPKADIILSEPRDFTPEEEREIEVLTDKYLKLLRNFDE